MPILTRNRVATAVRETAPELRPPLEGAVREEEPSRLGGAPDGTRPGVFATCANPSCGTGWLKLWRSRSGPVFEGGWSCSASCTARLLEAAVRRELEARGRVEESHRHRIPIGLAMLEQGWITGAQLRGALEAQRAAGGGRLGQWLVRQQGVSEQLVTRALGLQWSCPVLAMELHDAEGLTSLLPRLFVDAFGALPLRVAAGKILALMDGRFNVAIDDIRTAAMPALRHRVILNFEGEAEGITSEAVVRAILDEVTPPAVE